MRFLAVFSLLLLFSCKGDHVDAPNNLVSKDQMAIIIADLTIAEQISNIIEGNDIEIGTKEVIKKQNVNPKDFLDSYKYYIAINQAEGIIEESKKILLKLDPTASDTIKIQKIEESFEQLQVDKDQFRPTEEFQKQLK